MAPRSAMASSQSIPYDWVLFDWAMGAADLDRLEAPDGGTIAEGRTTPTAARRRATAAPDGPAAAVAAAGGGATCGAPAHEPTSPPLISASSRSKAATPTSSAKAALVNGLLNGFDDLGHSPARDGTWSEHGESDDDPSSPVTAHRVVAVASVSLEDHPTETARAPHSPGGARSSSPSRLSSSSVAAESPDRLPPPPRSPQSRPGPRSSTSRRSAPQSRAGA